MYAGVKNENKLKPITPALIVSLKKLCDKLGIKIKWR